MKRLAIFVLKKAMAFLSNECLEESDYWHFRKKEETFRFSGIVHTIMYHCFLILTLFLYDFKIYPISLMDYFLVLFVDSYRSVCMDVWKRPAWRFFKTENIFTEQQKTHGFGERKLQNVSKIQIHKNFELLFFVASLVFLEISQIYHRHTSTVYDSSTI